MKTFHCFEFKTLGSAYAFINKFNDDHEMTEIIPSAGGACVLFFTKTDPETTRIQLPDLNNQLSIQNFSADILNAHLGLAQGKLKKHLFILESKSVCEIFLKASIAKNQNAEILDLRIYRSSQVGGYLLITSDSEVDFNRGDLKNHHYFPVSALQIQITKMEVSSQQLKSFFEIAPRS